MAITYDKKMLKQLHKIVNGGKKAFAFKSSFLSSIIYFILMIGIQFLVHKKTDEDFVFDFFFIGTWLLASLFFFIFMYFIQLKQYKYQKAMYDESIKYFEKHDPDFLKELDF